MNKKNLYLKKELNIFFYFNKTAFKLVSLLMKKKKGKNVKNVFIFPH